MSVPGKVYMGRLHYSTRERDVEAFFKGYGRIRQITLKNGYGFVEFEDPRDADDAVYDLNGKSLCGERIQVEHTRNPNAGQRGGRGGYGSSYGGGGQDRIVPPLRTDYRIRVENLSSRVMWQDLKQHLSKVAEVTFADIKRDGKNEGIVEFATLGDMKNAITKLNGSVMDGKKIKLIEDRGSPRGRSSTPSHRRQRSESRGGGRSRTPRRSSRNSSTSRRRRNSRTPPPRRDSPRRKDSRSPRRSSPRKDSRSPRRVDSSRRNTRSPRKDNLRRDSYSPRRNSQSPRKDSRRRNSSRKYSRSPRRRDSGSAGRDSPRRKDSRSPVNGSRSPKRSDSGSWKRRGPRSPPEDSRRSNDRERHYSHSPPAKRSRSGSVDNGNDESPLERNGTNGRDQLSDGERSGSRD